MVDSAGAKRQRDKMLALNPNHYKELGKKNRDRMLAENPNYYSDLAKKRKVNSGGKTFKDPEAARLAAKARWENYYAKKENAGD